MKNYLSIALMFLIFASCSKDQIIKPINISRNTKPVMTVPVLPKDTIPTKPTQKPPPPFSKSDFPLQVGNWWRYLISTGGSHNPDTMIVHIISVRGQAGVTNIYSCIVTLNGILMDTEYIEESASTIRYYGRGESSYFGGFYLRFPFLPNDNYTGEYAYDSIRATAYEDSSNFLHITFKPSYLMYRHYKTATARLIQTYHFTPKVGLTEQSVNYYSTTFGQAVQSFFLLDYYVQ